ncbi:SDR family oxidoreductase [Pseudaquabacterium pictum]|uniref:Glucose-1-dehydrogenase n=1 Tax=Pseudaquabacterium pictum TaxID=2315236 RepID=A0A480AVJ5_9BURK|nr:SDR family oxidoreductase [Rubrivivax pictus]GCL64202.1 glucose-1-dehydrogenase [Rubrivivax pictus]
MTTSAPVLLITGASRGIGAATARLAAARGWDVAINYARDAAAAEAVAADVRAAGRRAITVAADVADEAAVLAMFNRVDAELGPLAGLVNNAGIVAMKARLDEMDVARWQRMWAVNLTGSFLCAREAVRRMSTRHGGSGGAIVNLGSVAARIGSPAMYVDYAASKGAVDTFTIGLAQELAAEGIRVNAVRPGIIDTDIHADSGDRHRPQAAAAVIPMGRPGTADEIAAAVLWLLSAEASYTTGAIVDVAGAR